MSDMGKRCLRERRAPKAFDDDNQEPDRYGYGRPAYIKDVRTPAQLLNAEARLLVKFIHSANKGAKEEAEKRRWEADNIKEPVAVRGGKARPAEVVPEVKRREEPGLTKTDMARKGREVYNFKLQLGNSVEPFPPKNESFLNKIKTITMESATNMRMLQMNLVKGKNETPKEQPPKEESLPKKGGTGEHWQPRALQSGNGKVSSNQSMNSFFLKDKQKMEKVQEVEERLGLQRSDFSNSNKIFKRSAYHVAIAYHIYLKKLRERGPIGGEIDPTFHARRLKDQMSRVSY